MNKIKEKIKNKNAITLVALVITIIILLILTGITISSITNTGLFEKAKDAKEKQIRTEILEKIELLKYEIEIEKNDNNTTTLKNKMIKEKMIDEKEINEKRNIKNQ